MKYDPDIHHRRSIRLHGYDYARNGAYFVTVCVQGRECLLGGIVNGEIEMNEAGRMVEDAWHGLVDRFTWMDIGEFVVMPNHFHGIILITNHNDEGFGLGRGEPCVRPMGEEANGLKRANTRFAPTPPAAGTGEYTVGRIIQAFKSMTTNAYIQGVKTQGWQPFPGRLWQRNYYERVIRNDDELRRARQYILDNPAKWDKDRDNPVNVPPTIAGIQRESVP